GEHHAGATEHAFFKVNIVVHRYIVLDFTVVADGDFIPDKDILPQGNTLTNFGSSANMHKMPDTAALTDLCAFINDGCFVLVIAHNCWPFTFSSSGWALLGLSTKGALRIWATVSMAARLSSTP